MNFPDVIAQSARSLAEENPTLAIVLVVIGVLSLGGAAWGAVKGFIKMAVVLGVVAAAAWFWYFSGG